MSDQPWRYLKRISGSIRSIKGELSDAPVPAQTRNTGACHGIERVRRAQVVIRCNYRSTEFGIWPGNVRDD